jgi:hypothetical protein
MSTKMSVVDIRLLAKACLGDETSFILAIEPYLKTIVRGNILRDVLFREYVEYSKAVLSMDRRFRFFFDIPKVLLQSVIPNFTARNNFWLTLLLIFILGMEILLDSFGHLPIMSEFKLYSELFIVWGTFGLWIYAIYTINFKHSRRKVISDIVQDLLLQAAELDQYYGFK